MSSLPILGAKAQPLSSYLKGIGLVAILAEQAHPDKCFAWRSAWINDVLHLHGPMSALDYNEIGGFLLNYWCPSPILSPWNSSTGFFGEVQEKMLSRFVASTSPRLSSYRKAIATAKKAIADLGVKPKPKGDEKAHLIKRLRNTMPDEAIAWIDCAVTLDKEEKIDYWRLFGTGGNDGNFDISRSYMQSIETLFHLGDFSPKKDNIDLLEIALLDSAKPGIKLRDYKIRPGMYHPDSVFANPWDFVLMVEGLTRLAPSIHRRMKVQKARFDGVQFPFSDLKWQDHESKGEFMAPLWGNFIQWHELKNWLQNPGNLKLPELTQRDSV